MRWLLILGLGIGCRYGFDPIVDAPGVDVTCAPGQICVVDCHTASACEVDCNHAATCAIACPATHCTVIECPFGACAVACDGHVASYHDAVATCP